MTYGRKSESSEYSDKRFLPHLSRSDAFGNVVGSIAYDTAAGLVDPIAHTTAVSMSQVSYS